MIGLSRTQTLFGVFVLFLLDQISKGIALSLNIPVHCNADGPFGASVAGLSWELIVFGVLVVFFATEWTRRSRSISFLFIASGGLGNMADRLLFGCVRDFIAIGHFPWFNLADTFLTVGALWFLFEIMQSYKQQKME